MTTVKLILTAFIVNLILPSSNLGHPMISSNSDQGASRKSGASLVHSDVQQNFQSLIESVAKSDSRRSEVYRGVLKDNVAYGQQAFDAMKDEIQTMQRRNVGRRRDHVESGMHHSGNVSPVKRETPATCSAPISGDNDEKNFVARYGNNNETSGVWQAVRDISSDEAKLRALCELAHNRTKSPISDVIDTVLFETKTISFTRYNDSALNHEPMQVDVVSYNITRQPPDRVPKFYFYHFTKGTEEGCILYLIRWKKNKKSEPVFRLGLNFCNVTVPV